MADTVKRMPEGCTKMVDNLDGTFSEAAVIYGMSRTTTWNTVTSLGNPSRIASTSVGQLLIKPYAPAEMDWNFACASPIIATTDLAVKGAGAAGIRNYVTAIEYHNTNAVATEIVIKDGAATVIWRGYAPANMALPAHITFPTPLKGTAATTVNVAAITTAANMYVNVHGYTAP